MLGMFGMLGMAAPGGGRFLSDTSALATTPPRKSATRPFNEDVCADATVVISESEHAHTNGRSLYISGHLNERGVGRGPAFAFRFRGCGRELNERQAEPL